MPPRSRSQRPYNPAVSRDSESPTREALGKRPRPSADRPLESGTLLGERYKIESVLGYGGMGVVYRARDVKLDCDIALKRIRPDRMSPERQQTLRHEIILSRRVTHENVCRVYDLVELNGEEFVSMEFVPGKTLKEIETDERVLALGRGLAIAKKICRGLAAAHRIGVLHRDLKPENVIVREGDDAPLICDFGLAMLRAQAMQLTGTGDILGTPLYMPPEQALGNRSKIGPPTDVYALGAITFFLLTGRAPFTGPNAFAVIDKVVKEPPPSVRSLNPSVAPKLESIVLKALAKDPKDRFRTCGEMKAALVALQP